MCNIRRLITSMIESFLWELIENIEIINFFLNMLSLSNYLSIS